MGRDAACCAFCPVRGSQQISSMMADCRRGVNEETRYVHDFCAGRNVLSQLGGDGKSWRLPKRSAGEAGAVEREAVEVAEDGDRNLLRLEKFLRQHLHFFLAYCPNRLQNLIQRIEAAKVKFLAR
jgi:hypothetical protein